MLFSMPRRNGGGWNGFKKVRLGDSTLAGCKTLIHYSPKRRDSSCFLVEEVFKEADFVEWRRIRISLAIVAELSNPPITTYG